MTNIHYQIASVPQSLRSLSVGRQVANSLREFDQDFSKTLAIPTPALEIYHIHIKSLALGVSL